MKTIKNKGAFAMSFLFWLFMVFVWFPISLVCRLAKMQGGSMTRRRYRRRRRW